MTEEELHNLAQYIIKREADQCAVDHSIRSKWDDQHIEVQYMIIGAMIEFAKLYANDKLQEAKRATIKALESLTEEID